MDITTTLHSIIKSSHPPQGILDLLEVEHKTEEDILRLERYIHSISIPKKTLTQLFESTKSDIARTTTLIANGDIEDLQDGKIKAKTLGFDGIMIGRGVFKNPFIFNDQYSLNEKGEIIDIHSHTPISIKSRLELLKKHIQLWKKIWFEKDTTQDEIVSLLIAHGCLDETVEDTGLFLQNRKHYPQLKKYFKIYISGFTGASGIRSQFMQTQSADEGIALANTLLKNYT